MKVLITGSSGLIGSEAAMFYDRLGHEVTGIDNNMRRVFFGPSGDTTWNQQRLLRECQHYRHIDASVFDRNRMTDLVWHTKPDLVIHCAAQPSHDRARDIPMLDFQVNAVGTMVMLEAVRQHAPEAVFIHVSTSKVYGDTPNNEYDFPVTQLPTRWRTDIVDESCSIDQCLHSLFGASKTAGDIMAQEYGRYYGLRTGIFRPGCLTGPAHSPVEQHGFLAFLVMCAMTGQTYKVFGYQGKQVRDNLHSYDVVTAFDEFRKNPHEIGSPSDWRPAYGEVYNLGGGFENSCSILEAFDLVKQVTGKEVKWEYVDKVRLGDHRCYISDLSKIRNHYPDWKITKTLPMIIEELALRFSSEPDLSASSPWQPGGAPLSGQAATGFVNPKPR